MWIATPVVVLLIIIVGGGLWFRSMMNRPLYQPGLLAQSTDLSFDSPAQPDNLSADRWLIEDGVELHHFETGTGKPVIVVHGGPGYPFPQPIAALDGFTSDHRFIYYDQRGCGQSTRPIDSFSSSNFYQNMLRLDKSLGLGAQIADIERIRRLACKDSADGKVTLIAHSFGGFLAAMYAAEFPEHVRSLILLAPADVLVFPQAPDAGIFDIVASKLPDDLKPEYAQFKTEYLDFKNLFTNNDADLQVLNATFAGYYMVAAGMSQEMPPISELLTNEEGGWMVQAMYLSMGRVHDYRDAIRKTADVPVLVLHGSEDLLPASGSRTYAELYPDATLQIIEGAGHDIHSTNPDAFASAVREFLAKH